MARLEFEFVSVGAKSVDNELNNIKTSFSNVNGLLKDNIKDSIIYSNALKEVSSKLKQAGDRTLCINIKQIEFFGNNHIKTKFEKELIKVHLDFEEIKQLIKNAQ